MNEELIFLHFSLNAADPTPPAIPKPEFTAFLSLKNGDEANVTTIKLSATPARTWMRPVTCLMRASRSSISGPMNSSSPGRWCVT